MPVLARSGGGSGSRLGNTGSSSGGSSGGDDRLLGALRSEPVAFLGGMVAGALALSLDAEPLRSWIEATAAESGLRYQATVQRLEQERAARTSTSYDVVD